MTTNAAESREGVASDAARGAHAIVVIGGGPGGISVAVNLIKAGVEDFVVLDKATGPGGTWWHNRYPGAEVDVTSELYSFSFMSHAFTRSHVRQPELLQYIEQTVDHFGIRDKFRFGVEVKTVAWKDGAWTITAADGSRYRARFVVSAVGMLCDPHIPDWPGLTDFAGRSFHTSLWPSQLDLEGKKVAVIGTGSTAAQVVPGIVDKVAHLYLFQRQPGWVLPKMERDYPAEEIVSLRRSRLRRSWRRLKAFLKMEVTRTAAKEGSARNRRMQQLALDYLGATIGDAAKRDALTPGYPFGRKRPVLSSEFLPALGRNNVTVVPRAVERLSKHGVVDGSGTETPVDVVVIATGFQAANFLSSIEVLGPDGRSLREVWAGEPSAFLGLMVPDFPNFFMLYGPNTNGGDVMFTLERQAEWVARAMARASHRKLARIEVKRNLFEYADKMIERRNNRFAWASGTNNYYTSASGKVVTQWPYTQTFYSLLLRLSGVGLTCRTVALKSGEAMVPSAVSGASTPQASDAPDAEMLAGSNHG